MKRAWPLVLVLAFAAAACGHAESPGANVALGPARACPEGAVDDGFECVAKHAEGAHADDDDREDERTSAKGKSARACDPFDEECDDGSLAAASLSNEADYFAHGFKAFQAHDYTQARRLFFEMLQKYPTGNHPDDAYYYFGMMFYEEAHKDHPTDPTKLQLAAQSFEQVTLYPTSTQLLPALMRLLAVYGELKDQTKTAATLQRLQALPKKNPAPIGPVPKLTPVPVP